MNIGRYVNMNNLRFYIIKNILPDNINVDDFICLKHVINIKGELYSVYFLKEETLKMKYWVIEYRSHYIIDNNNKVYKNRQSGNLQDVPKFWKNFKIRYPELFI